MLVGQGGVGKSSLVKALTTGKFNSREKARRHQDHGLGMPSDATDQFFLTARSLYLLVCNRRTGAWTAKPIPGSA